MHVVQLYSLARAAEIFYPWNVQYSDFRQTLLTKNRSIYVVSTFIDKDSFSLSIQRRQRWKLKIGLLKKAIEFVDYLNARRN